MIVRPCAEVPYAEVMQLFIPELREAGEGRLEEVRWIRNRPEVWGPSRDPGAIAFGRRACVEIGGESTTPSAYRLAQDPEAEPASVHDVASVVLHLRARSGLTWDQLARAMKVDKRSLHNWAAGSPINACNQERLVRLRATLDFIDRGFSDQTKRALLTPTPDGRLALDWLADGRDEDVKRLLGAGPGPRAEASRLAPEERARRRPPSPVALLDARSEGPSAPLEPRRVVMKIRGPA